MADVITTITRELQRFALDHRGETFYALAIDAGYVCLNSEEAFEQTRQRYLLRWETETEPLTAEQADDDDVEFFLRRNAEATIDDYLAEENQSRAQSRLVGNPYADPASDASRSLRDRPGNWRYGEIVACVPDDAYFAHYDLNEDEQRASPYQNAVRAVLEELSAQRDTVLAGLDLSPDFRFFAADHAY